MLPYFITGVAAVIILYGMYKMRNLRKVSLSVWKLLNFTIESDDSDDVNRDTPSPSPIGEKQG